MSYLISMTEMLIGAVSRPQVAILHFKRPYLPTFGLSFASTFPLLNRHAKLPTAAQRVFDLYEVLEQILLADYIRPEDLRLP